MSDSSPFTAQARKYSVFYRRGLAWSAMIRWLPAGPLLGIALYVVLDRMGYNPGRRILPLALLPPLAGGVTALITGSGVYRALVWLDHATGGKQELQAAWEFRDSRSGLKSLILDAGHRKLLEQGNRPTVPRPGPVSVLIATASAALLVLAFLAGVALLAPPDPGLVERGTEMEAWAESWAERSLGSGRPESRELADRMGHLGRRMADGSMTEGQAERALKQLEEDIQERQEDLVRDRLAESLVEDLGISRESAEMFRVQRRRLPADVLAEIGGALGGRSGVSEMSREALESLLANPDFRDSSGGAKPELTEKLTQALKDALDENDPRLKELEEAASRSRRARGENGSSPGGGESGDPTGDKMPGSSAGSGSADGSPGEDGTSEEIQGRTGGGGRGSAKVKDEASDSSPLYPSTAEEPLRLPARTDRTGSWKTVIRAFTEDRSASPTPDGELSAEWNNEVEAVIAREDIPPGVRDYVRDYFLALEEGPSDSGDEE